jgi:hypothetical protein
MLRRSFICGAAWVALSRNLPLAMNSQKVTAIPKCSEKRDTVSNLEIVEAHGDPNNNMEKNYPLPRLTRITDFALSVNYVRPRGSGSLMSWDRHPAAKDRIKRAVELMNTVWSSREFKDRVNAAPLLWWKFTKPEGNSERQITGPALYELLMRNKTPTVDVSMKAGRAAAVSHGNTMTIIQGYLNKATVFQICNTISHEYTHLDSGGQSEDYGFESAPDQSLFVSYGIGGLTEELAAGEKLYCSNLAPSH